MSDLAPDHPDHPAGLRRAAAEGKRAKAEAAALRRDMQFLRRGVDPATPYGRGVVSTFEGDSDDVQAIVAHIESFVSSTPGVVLPERSGPPDVVFAQGEEQSTAERQALASGAIPDGPMPDPNPWDVAERQGHDIIRAGGRADDVLANAFATVVRAADAGDERVRIRK